MPKFVTKAFTDEEGYMWEEYSDGTSNVVGWADKKSIYSEVLKIVEVTSSKKPKNENIEQSISNLFQLSYNPARAEATKFNWLQYNQRGNAQRILQELGGQLPNTKIPQSLTSRALGFDKPWTNSLFPQKKPYNRFGKIEFLTEYEAQLPWNKWWIKGSQEMEKLSIDNGNQESLSDKDFINLANEIGVIDFKVLKAIAMNETKDAFYKPNQATVLFERHYMYEILKEKGIDVEHLTINPDLEQIVRKKPLENYGSYKSQYEKLSKAKGIDESAAIQSSSWGRFQVMGKWYKLRYNSPQELEKAMNSSEVEQLFYFGAFLKNDPILINAINSRNWTEIAMRYNGKNWKKTNPNYATNLKINYDKISKR